MSYPKLAETLERQLTGNEWRLVAYYILKAEEYGNDAGRESAARESLEDAIAVAMAQGELSAAKKIQYFLRFY